jgi:hypothetical protein
VVGLERAGRSNCVIDAGGTFQLVRFSRAFLTSAIPEVPWTEAKMLPKAALLKEQRRRDCARRH